MRLIDADALMEWAVNIGCNGRWGISLDDLTDAIGDAPTIDPVKHGEWERNVNKNGFMMWTCSICKCEKHKKKGLKFCPNCGTRMDG